MTTQPHPVDANLSLPSQGQTPGEQTEKPFVACPSRRSMTRRFRVRTIGRSVLSVIIRVWRRFLAENRFVSTIVCEESAQLGYYDYHTYADDVDAAPWFAEGGARCKRCGKRFRL
jgi:hypothetical protein